MQQRLWQPVIHRCGEPLARLTTAQGVQYYPPPISRVLVPAVALVECPRCHVALYDADMRPQSEKSPR